MKIEGVLPRERNAAWRRALVLVLLCGLLAAIASSARLNDALLAVLAVSEQLIRAHPYAGAALFVLFAAVSAMLAFVSIAVIVPVAVYSWGQPLSMLLLWLGWILGGVCAYGIGRYLGRTAVRWFTADAGLRRLESYIAPQTPFLLVLLLQIALPSEIPGYLLGLVRYPLGRYLLALGLAELPYAVATVTLGANFLEGRGYVVLGVGLVIVTFSLVAFHRLRARLGVQDAYDRTGA